MLCVPALVHAQEKIFVDINKTISINTKELRQFNIIGLNNYNLGEISSVKYIPEHGILIQSGQELFLYEDSSNSLICKYSQLGRAHNEYTYLTDFGYDRILKRVYIFDSQYDKMIWNTPDGEYICSEEIKDTGDYTTFSAIIRYDERYYIGKRMFGVGVIPELSLYDSSYRYVSSIGNDLTLRSGISMYKQLSMDDKGNVIYNQYFSNDILVVTPNGIKTKYIVDFGKYNIPDPKKYKDEFELISDINSSNKRYATFISNICDSEKYLSFAFITNPGLLCLCVYDKKLKTTDVYTIDDKKYSLAQIIPTESFAYILLADESGDYYMGKQQYTNKK